MPSCLYISPKRILMITPQRPPPKGLSHTTPPSNQRSHRLRIPTSDPHNRNAGATFSRAVGNRDGGRRRHQIQRPASRIAMARPWRRPTRLLLALALLAAAAALVCAGGGRQPDGGGHRHRSHEGTTDLGRRTRRTIGGSTGRVQATDAGAQAGEVELDGGLLRDRRPARRLQVRLCVMTRRGRCVDWERGADRMDIRLIECVCVRPSPHQHTGGGSANRRLHRLRPRPQSPRPH